MTIQQSSLLKGRPTGTILMFAATPAPTGWLICDGSAISRTLYSELYRLIGTNFGSGDGTTTFNVPDMRGRIPVGYGSYGGHSDVATIGNNENVAAANRRPSHNHTNGITYTHTLTLMNHAHVLNWSNHTHTYSSSVGGQNFGDGDGSATEYTDGVGGSFGGSANFSISNPTTLPNLNGTITPGGTIGPAGTNANDTPPYLVLNFIIKY